jgi:hypothetical protein
MMNFHNFECFAASLDLVGAARADYVESKMMQGR